MTTTEMPGWTKENRADAGVVSLRWLAAGALATALALLAAALADARLPAALGRAASPQRFRGQVAHEHLENIKIGDVVVIKDDNLPAGKWAMGRVTEVHPGHDGLIRVVTLKTKNGLMKRPVAKLSILSLQPQKEGSVYQQEKERKEDKYQSSKKYRSASKVSNFMSMTITFILFITFISPTSASYNITHFKNNQSVYLDYISDLQIIRAEWTMIV
ncbi:jg9687 [Pararge aegeria aegeria]|uniref:Jg9687 protein n=1 Tax=Pararge aegeria aegeria TaxID=348720 RepID=A0A8S4RSU3_9NEOP|nr:jg9687 [Pararge aegeria aegeria]